MADSREERMQQRMRGAGRHEVADESFGLILPVEEESPEASPEAPTPQPEPAPAPVSRSTPNTSAKRRRLASDAPRTEQQPPSTRSASSRQSSSASKSDPYEIAPDPEPEPESEPESEPEPQPQPQPQPQHGPGPLRPSPAVLPQSTVEQPEDGEPRTAAPGFAQRRTSRGSASPRLSGGANMVEEVTESPANAPGSGHRRRVRDSSAVATQSTKLQKAVMMEDNELTGGVTTSSPLARKTRMSGSTSDNLSIRTARTAGPSSLAEAAEANDASSPSARPRRNTPTPASGSSQSSGSRRSTRSAILGEPDELSSPVPLVESRRRAQAKAKAKRPSAPAGPPEEVNELTGPQTKPKAKRKIVPAAAPEVDEETPVAQAKPVAKQTKGPAKAVKKATEAAKPQAKPKPKRNKAPVEAPEEIEEDPAPPKPKAKAARAPAEADGEEAEEVSAHEAALRIGKKRGRPSLSQKRSPEVDARASEDERPAKKRRQRRSQESPAQQSQPKPPKNLGKTKTKTKTKTKSTGDVAKARRRRSDGEDIPISVQRYNKPPPRSADDSDTDVLQMEIPFANRSGVNVVDVLSQICDEVVESSLEGLLEAAVNAETAAAKRECKTKIRAVKAFQEELRTRLIQHTIALDSMHGLKKRVRAMQKEKVALRKEILGIRAEREQVALKMDAIRTTHESESQEALHHLGLSSTMHNIELAIDQGRSAPEPTAKEQKLAELANLEVLVSRVADQACVGEGGGGNLKQIRDFNAFLERAATALETR